MRPFVLVSLALIGGEERVQTFSFLSITNGRWSRVKTKKNQLENFTHVVKYIVANLHSRPILWAWN